MDSSDDDPVPFHSGDEVDSDDELPTLISSKNTSAPAGTKTEEDVVMSDSDDSESPPTSSQVVVVRRLLFRGCPADDVREVRTIPSPYRCGWAAL